MSQVPSRQLREVRASLVRPAGTMAMTPRLPGVALRLALFVLALSTSGAALAQGRTWHLLPTGNGHGFQVFDRQQSRITYFLEHPYRYVAPGNDDRTFGIGRRDLAHDIYFGVRVGTTSKWLNRCGSPDCQDFSSVEYENQSHVIKASASVQGVAIDTHYFAPFGYAGNAMLMLAKVRNTTGGPLTVSLYAKPNMKLGNGRVDPTDVGETLTWNPSATPPHGEETGPGGGRALYIPITDATRVGCGGDSALYNAMLQSGNSGTTQSCNGNDQVMVFQKELQLEAGAEAWWGLAILFLNDNPNDARASTFRDTRTKTEILSLWRAFAGTKDARALHDDALSELEAWRKNTAPAGLSDKERRIWRQSEVVLRMSQIRERVRKNDGMMLASLAPGEWHTGWVRDGTYSITALAMTGHVTEARLGVEFFLSADAGFFRANNYLGRDYRVGICRYFGNGLEEGDFNQDGPNLETDGWGLMLWAARLVLHKSCDKGWLSTNTWKGDSIFAALLQTAEDMAATRQGSLPKPDASIWEVHWDRRQIFSYTAASWVRGLYDFADIAAFNGRADLESRFRSMANDMMSASRSSLVHTPSQSFASHAGVAGNDVHVDGSTVAFLDFGLLPPSDPLYTGTLASFSRLTTGFGGYRRLEPQLSLTGGGSAGEYDLAEWILLDLRIADAFRRAGNVAKANELLNKVTDQAANNDNLIPELFDPNNGRYTGVVPMAGYGAGAYMWSQLVKHGIEQPAYNAGFSHCSPCAGNPCTGQNEVCAEGDGGFVCNCAAGTHREGNACVADTVCSPATTCSGHGTCTGTGLQCTCDAGYSGANCGECAADHHRESGACVPNTPCNPNPCTEANRTRCETSGSSHTCSCDAGFKLEAGACVPDSVTPQDGGTTTGLGDGKALLCASAGLADLALWLLTLLFVVALLSRRARR